MDPVQHFRGLLHALFTHQGLVRDANMIHLWEGGVKSPSKSFKGMRFNEIVPVYHASSRNNRQREGSPRTRMP